MMDYSGLMPWFGAEGGRGVVAPQVAIHWRGPDRPHNMSFPQFIND
jgi:hypothetical protein